MKIECQLKPTKDGNGFYLYIPLIEKRVFLEKVEQKLIQILMDTQKDEKSANK